jgi:hypothetical protein
VVTWQRWDGHDFEIFYFDGSGTYRVTSNGRDDMNPEVSAGQIAWEGFDDTDWEIFTVMLPTGVSGPFSCTETARGGEFGIGWELALLLPALIGMRRAAL